MGKCASLPVLAVLLATGFVYHVTVFLVIEHWLSLKTAPGLMNALLFTALTAMALISYALAVLRDAGAVPHDYIPDTEDSRTVLHEIKRKGGDLRFCQKCRHYKPPRAHHCRFCKRCVLRMDHHCIWISNCVGYNNYKAFFLFVLYVVAACIHSLVLFGGHAIQALESEEHNMSGPSRSSLFASSTALKVICLILLIPLSIALIVLLSWHVYLIFTNKTTIEYHEGVRAYWLAEKAGQVYQHPYDLGFYSNIVLILGPNTMTWLCPASVGHLGSGLQFQTIQNYTLSDV